MARLSSSELGQALDFVREAEDLTGHTPFPVRVLHLLGQLVAADAVSWHEWSCDDGRHHYSISTKALDETAAVWEAYPEYRWQDPLPGGCPGADAPSPALVGRTLKISDFLSLRDFRRLELHAYVCRPLGIDYVMKLFLPNRGGIARSFVFDRGRRDFGERDRLLVDLLRPHLVHLEESARARRLANAFAVGAEEAGSLIVLNSLDRIEFATASTRRLLREYADDGGGARLPTVVEAWLRRDREGSTGAAFPEPRRPLTVLRESRRLVVRRVGSVLLLHEEVARLTRREHEILDLVAAGHSNAEIATSLWISPGTVRIHLQHVYKKLGVANRTAAVARAQELIGSRRSLRNDEAT
jgi:DNA-binding CsgD family transcriptional regulator